MTKELELLLILSLIVLAFITVQTSKLRRAAVYLGAFSLLSSFAYLSYNAPDVALAEAVIGCTLSTIFILIALKKHHVITIYYVENEFEDTAVIKKERRELITSLETFLIERGFEPQTISTHLDDPMASENDRFDLLVEHTKNDINIYSSGMRYITPDIEEYLKTHKPPHLNASFFCLKEGREEGAAD